MGADIHMYLEYRVDHGPWQPDPHHKSNIEYEGTEDEYENINPITATGRNYELFSALAQVRGWGGDGRKPLGIPKDVTTLIKRASDSWGCDGHSHSYISIPEYKNILDKLQYTKTTRSDAFYDYDKYREKYGNKQWDHMPPDFTTIINYCAEFRQKLQVDNIILGDENAETPVEFRLVFWFDN